MTPNDIYVGLPKEDWELISEALSLSLRNVSEIPSDFISIFHVKVDTDQALKRIRRTIDRVTQNATQSQSETTGN